MDRGEIMDFQTISIREFNEYRKRPDAWVIDLRSKEEFEEVHVEGARNVPYEELDMFRKYLPKDKLYIFYCDRGSSSLMAAKELSRDGYRAATLIGGMQAVLQKR
ncbi:MAG: rhodanese-like domain-containing protein [Lachnospiraceae bacterium]|nr:rhodanese-like domain-containing protein [Lachnospiraceae bacterium]